MASPSAESTLRVRYAETDAQGVVYHSNFIIYFEVGRVNFLRDQGLDYRALEAGGHWVVVVEARARYRAPARFDDELVVVTSIKEVRRRSFTCEYRVLRGETLVCEGETAHVCVGPDGQAIALPDDLRRVLLGETLGA